MADNSGVTDALNASIAAYLRRLKDGLGDADDQESLEVAIDCLTAVMNVDPAAEAAAPDLLATFVSGGGGGGASGAAAAAAAAAEAEVEDDPRFAEFVAALSKSGFFQGVQEGSVEYSSRMDKARAKYDERLLEAADAFKANGNTELKAGNYEAAIEHYSNAITTYPKNAVYYCNRAVAYQKMSNYEAAIADCNRAIEVDPDYAKGWSRLGNSHQDQKNYEEAAAAYRRALELNPDSDVVRQNLATVEGIIANGGEGAGSSPGAPANPFAGADGGVPDVASMLNNPQFAAMAQEAMANPQMAAMAQQMMSDPAALQNIMSMFGGGGGGGGGGGAP